MKSTKKEPPSVEGWWEIRTLVRRTRLVRVEDFATPAGRALELLLKHHGIDTTKGFGTERGEDGKSTVYFQTEERLVDRVVLNERSGPLGIDEEPPAGLYPVPRVAPGKTGVQKKPEGWVDRKRLHE